MRIGIIGMGTVGETIYETLRDYHRVVAWDKNKIYDGLEEVLDTDAIFIAVPTPERHGCLDSRMVDEVLEILSGEGYSGVVCIKSTMGLNETERLLDRHDGLDVIYSPEFMHGDLRRFEDFRNPHFIVVAGERWEILKDVFSWVSKDRFHKVSFRDAEIIKLGLNAYAGMKVSFTNEINSVADDPVEVMEIMTTDPRCARPYTDPTKGAYGGDCLPKDIRDLSSKTGSPLFRAIEEVNKRAEGSS